MAKKSPTIKACPTEKAQFAYTPSKKAKRDLHKLHENWAKEARQRAREESALYGTMKIRPVETCDITESNCWVIAIFEGKNKVVKYNLYNSDYKTKEEAEKDIPSIKKRMRRSRGCFIRPMRIEEFKRLELEGYDLYERADYESVCGIGL